MNYQVKYKPVHSLFWKSISKVKGDGILEETGQRFFILEDETRVELPTANMLFRFSKERFYSIKQQMEKEAGRPIPT